MKNIRNFAIIAHVDHGKSTLADRLLEKTNTVSKEKMKEQFLDQSPISRERGITIKLAPVRMKFSEYYLNLIDTPGHVDFSYEVSRTLAACEGAVLLVDATQGVQAQTVAHFLDAKSAGLKIIPVVNKIDLPNARVPEVKQEISEMFSFEKSEILEISAKTGQGVDNLLNKIIEEIPSPGGESNRPFRALVFDAVFDEHRGVIAYIRVVDGSIQRGQKIKFFQSGKESIASDIGYFTPYLDSQGKLSEGEIGYIVTGIKDIRETRVGDTIYLSGMAVEPLSGYERPKPMVFFGIYPKIPSELGKLKEALQKISLNDNSITYSDEYSSFLGSGFRGGFLGLLHAEIIKQRIEREENLDILLTMPQVLYEKKDDGGILEPYILLTVYVPKDFVGAVMTACQRKKGNLVDLVYYQNNAVLKFEIPYTMLIRGLSSELKSISSGFASMDYEPIGFRDADLSEIEILINGELIDVLSEKAYREEAQYLARDKALKLKDSLPRQQFRQIIQATINGQILAREEVPPFRKDVLAKMSGGDRTRKDKLLEAQKKGKNKLKKTGKIELPQDLLYNLIS